MIEIERDSDAYRYLENTFKNGQADMLRLDIRRDGIAFKINEGMWTPTLMVTRRPNDDNPGLKYHRC